MPPWSNNDGRQFCETWLEYMIVTAPACACTAAYFDQGQQCLKIKRLLTTKPIWVIVFLLLKSKHNCPLLIFLVIALMMKFCKSLRRQLRDQFPMTASFPSDKSTLDRRKKLWKTFCRGNYLLLQSFEKIDDSPTMMMMISIRLSLMKSNAVAP